MSKIGKFLKAIGAIVSKPSRLNLVLDDNEVWKKNADQKIIEQNGLLQVDLLELFPGFNESVKPYSFLDGTSLITDLALLRSLARKFNKCEYLEIGTWRGESVANVAEVAAHCVTINLPDEELLRMGKSKEYISLHRFYSKDLKNVSHIQHNSLTFDYSTLNKKFDLIFVDGDHHFENVKKDTQNIFGLLKNEHSIIVWHDYAFSPEKIRWEVLSGILAGVPKPEHRYLYHVANTLCCIYSKQTLKTRLFKVDQQPNKKFELTITSNSSK
jgi:predicted O-methyltransferase YrrM